LRLADRGEAAVIVRIEIHGRARRVARRRAPALQARLHLLERREVGLELLLLRLADALFEVLYLAAHEVQDALLAREELVDGHRVGIDIAEHTLVDARRAVVRRGVDARREVRHARLDIAAPRARLHAEFEGRELGALSDLGGDELVHAHPAGGRAGVAV